MQINGNQYNIKTINLGYDSAEAAEESNELDLDGFRGLGLCIAYESVLSEDETITLTIEADNDGTSGFTPSYSTIQTATVIETGPTGGGTMSGTAYLPIDVTLYERYAKFRTTLATSSGTNNIDYNVVAVLTDPEVAPNATGLTLNSVDIS